MKSKRIQTEADIKDFVMQKTVKITVNYHQSKELILLLILLRERLVESIEVILNNLTIFLSLNNENTSICSLTGLNKNIFKGKISMNSLEYLLYFLLKYYRDDIGEAEHIDVDFTLVNGGEVTLVIKNEVYKEYSEIEINRLLGL